MTAVTSVNLLTRFEQRNATDRAAVAAVDVWADILGEYKYFSPRITLIEMPPTIIQVKVKPNSRVSRLEQQEDETWLAELKSPPVDGKANEELIMLVAKYFKRAKSEVSIKSGASNRTKLVQIHENRL